MMDPVQCSPCLTDLSQELLCQIIKHLTVREAISLTLLCRKLRDAVELHFRICKVLDFGSRNVVTYLPCHLDDDNLHAFLEKCPQVEYIYGFNPRLLEQRRLRGGGNLTLRGIIDAFSLCKNLKGVDTACVRLMEAILNQLPNVTILGHFSNKTNDEQTPLSLKRINIPSNPNVTSLTLTGVDIPELTRMPEVEYLVLQFIRFSKHNPFKYFSAPNLKTCILSHVTGPTIASRYQAFFLALGEAEELSHLELVHVPLLSGTIRSATAEHRRLGGRGFRKLKTLCISNCTELHDMDFGSLSIMSMFNLECLSMQATFTKNTFFAALHVACAALDSSYAKVHTLRLGYMGNAGYEGPIGRHPLEVEGSRFAENANLQALVSDTGMQNAVKLFPNVTSLYVGNSPHIRNPNIWREEGKPNWRGLTNLVLKRCDGLRTHVITSYVAELLQLQTLLLEDLFPEVPVTDPNVGLAKNAESGFHLNSGMPNQSTFGSQNPYRISGNATSGLGSLNLQSSAPNVPNNGQQNQEPENNDAPPPVIGEPPEDENEGANNNKPAPEQLLDASLSCGHRDRLKCESGEPNMDDLAVPGPSGVHNHLTTKEVSEGLDDPANKETATLKIHSKHVCPVCHQDVKDTGKPQRSSVGCQVTYVHCRCKFIDEDDSDDDDEEMVGSSHDCETMSSSGKHERRPSTSSSDSTKMCDKATTTNDPLLPKDPYQMFELTSRSLVSITINACGVSHLKITNIQTLQHLEVLNCRILKTISLHGCPTLERITVIDCLKFDMKSLISEVLALQLNSPCIVYLHPYVSKVHLDQPDKSKEVKTKDILEAVFDRRMKWHHSCVLIDNGLAKSAWDDRGVHRSAFLEWMKHMTAVNRKLIEENAVSQTGNREFTIEWPVSKSKGQMLCQGDYKMVSDNPFLTKLWTRHLPKNIGLPTIESCACSNLSECTRFLQADAKKWNTSGRKLFRNHVGFYVYAAAHMPPSRIP